MTALTISIIGVGDPPPCEGQEGSVIGGTLERCAIIEKGTDQGRPAVAFLVRLPDGRQVFAQTTSRMFMAIAAALRGASQKWGVSPE